MKLSDDEKRKAIEAAQGIKDAASAENLEARSETIQEMEQGTPQTPGYQPDYGQTIKPAPQWPQTQEAQLNEQNQDQDMDKDDHLITGANSAAAPEARREQAQATPGRADSNAFEQALAEKLQETTPASLDKSRDIDR